MDTLQNADSTDCAVCGRSLAEIAGSNLGGMDVYYEYFVLCKVSATGRSLEKRSPTEFGVTECEREASAIRRS